MNTQLPPNLRAAQAVLDATDEWASYDIPVGLIAAAAFRAARDELAPNKTIEDIAYVHQSYVDGYKDALDEILAIATELETQ